MTYDKAFQPSLALVACLSAAVLTACGGGGGGTEQAATASDTTTTSASTSSEVAHAELAAATAPATSTTTTTTATTTASETINVTATNGGKSISTSPTLLKANGQPVTTLNELPEGIAYSAWMKKTTGRLPLRVVLGNGTYYLSTPWTWTPAQSGRADSPVTIEAQSAGGVIISGASEVSVPVSTHQGAAKVTANFAASGLSSFEQLWVNGGRAVRARTPNIGQFYYVKSSVSAWNGSGTYNNAPVNQQVFGADPATMPYLQGLTTEQKAGAVLVAVHSWTTSHHHIEEWNGSNQVRVSPASKWPFLYAKFGFAQRYFVENIPSALDAAGEWYLDRTTSQVTFMPNATQKLSNIVFSAPKLRQLLELKGQVSLGRWVEYLNFKGLKFRYAHSPLPDAGFIDSQSAVLVEAALQMDGVRNASVTDCEVSRVGGYAMWLRRNVRNVTVSGCEIYDTGAGGIKVGLNTQAEDANATGYNQIIKNRVHATGFQFPAGVGVWVGQSSYNNVSDNLIADTTYSAVSVGWTWGYEGLAGHHNSVNRNFIYNIMQGALSDGGAIYTLGVSPGTQIKGNVIKNVRAFTQYGAGAWGLYNDEGSSNIAMDSNIVVDTDNGGYLMHFGLANVVSNNVFTRGKQGEVQVTVAESSEQVSFQRNYIIPTVAEFINYGASQPNTAYVSNLVGRQYVPSLVPPAQCGSGCNVSSGVSLNAGGLLDIPVLTSGGVAVKLPSAMPSTWSQSQLTPSTSPSSWWTVSPTSVPSRNFEFDAAIADFGTPPGMAVIPSKRPELISVIRNSSGEKCLAYQDGGLTNAWEPYSFVDTNFDTGQTSVTFTLKADATTEFIHEWRDYRNTPYKTGPRVVLSGTRGVMVNYQKVANLPVGQWVTITVTGRQGADASWGLQVKYADGTTANFSNYAPYTTGWSSTKAVYFISNSTVTSTPCIGKITIANQ